MASGRLISFLRPAPIALVVAIAAPSGAVRAQTDPRLVAAVKLAQDGFADSARAVVQRLLDASQPTDSLYAEMLYTSGLVAATDADRRLALRKVVVEHSRSAWADDALLLLAQTEYANGNPGATVSQAQKLVSDYPLSPLRPVGALWGARAAADLGNAATACELAAAGLAAPNDDLEITYQLNYQKQRCSALALAQAKDSAAARPPTDSARPKPAEPAEKPPPVSKPVPKPAPQAPPGSFQVQIIAAPTAAKAAEAAASLTKLGFQSETVAEGGYFKVRAGPFATRAEAQAALAKIQRGLGIKPFIVVVK